MCGGETETFGFDSQTSITESCACLSFQLNQVFWQTLIRSNSHSRHVRNEITIGKDQFCCKNLSPYLETLIQIRQIAIGDAKVSITKEMFELVCHGKDHRIQRQSPG